MVIAVVLVGTLAPEEGRAQDGDAGRSLASGLMPPGEAEAEAKRETEDETERFELSFGLAPMGTLGLVGLGVGGGVGGLQAGVPMALDAGIPLGSRALLVVSITGAYGESGGSMHFLNLSVPLGVLVYLDRPRAGALVPTLRIAGVGAYSTSFGSEALSLGLGVRAGATWFPIEPLGVRGELGAGASAAFTGDVTVLSLNLQGGLSLVVRI